MRVEGADELMSCECGCGGEPKPGNRFIRNHHSSLRKRPALDRLMEKVIWNGDEDECWVFEGSKGHYGHGYLNVDGRNRQAHVIAYEAFIGPVPAELELDHLCRNPPCVNPSHLEPVTHRENILRGLSPQAENARKTHCPQGHPYSGDNLYEAPGRAGSHRQCRTCIKARNAAKRSEETESV